MRGDLVSLAMSGVLAFAVGCPSPIRFPEIDPKPAAGFSSFRDHDGLRVAVDPYFSRDRVRTAFRIDLTQLDVLPVLIVFENGTNVVFSLDRSAVSLVRASDRVSEHTVADAPAAVDHASRRARRTTTAIGTAGAAVVLSAWLIGAGAVIPAGALLIPAGIAMEHSATTRARIHNHLIASELGSRTLHPAQSARGFVYFKVDTSGVDPQSLAVQVRLQQVPERTTWEVVIPLIAPGGRVE